MATPPFSIATAVPGDTDLLSAYPPVERTYRDVVSSWLTSISDPTTGLVKGSAMPTPATSQTFTANGTWTKPTGCRKIVIQAVGGGGGSGGVDGQGAGTNGATGGGGSGFYGLTVVLDVSAETSAAVTIGAAGAAGASGANDGGNGGNTSITIGATTYTWGGGIGSAGLTSGANNITLGGAGGSGTNVQGGSWKGENGFHDFSSFGVAQAGNGGSNPLGTGGAGRRAVGSQVLTGLVGDGRGSGGGGSAVGNVTTNTAGAAGKAGFMRIWEFY